MFLENCIQFLFSSALSLYPLMLKLLTSWLFACLGGFDTKTYNDTGRPHL